MERERKADAYGIRRRRLEAQPKIALEELARESAYVDQSGVTRRLRQSTISRLETGETHSPSVHTLRAVLHGLEVCEGRRRAADVRRVAVDAAREQEAEREDRPL